MLVALDLLVFVPELLADASSVLLSSIGLLLLIGFQIRGIVAACQDLGWLPARWLLTRAQPVVTSQIPQPASSSQPEQDQSEQPVSPPAVPTVPPPVPPPPPASFLGGAVVRQTVRIRTYPEQVYISRSGASYHLFSDCQYIRNRNGISHPLLCSQCEQRTRN